MYDDDSITWDDAAFAQIDAAVAAHNQFCGSTDGSELPKQLVDLPDDVLAVVLARVPFRSPESLVPPGFYWNPLVAAQLRLVCKRFLKLMNTKAFLTEVKGAPMGRATLEELSHQVQTSLRLEATTVVRGRIRKIQSHQLQNGSIEQWMTVSDHTGSYTVALTEQALDQLISCIDPLAPTPNLAEYQAMMDHPMYDPNLHVLLLKRSGS